MDSPEGSFCYTKLCALLLISSVKGVFLRLVGAERIISVNYKVIAKGSEEKRRVSDEEEICNYVVDSIYKQCSDDNRLFLSD